MLFNHIFGVDRPNTPTKLTASVLQCFPQYIIIYFQTNTSPLDGLHYRSQTKVHQHATEVLYALTVRLLKPFGDSIMRRQRNMKNDQGEENA